MVLKIIEAKYGAPDDAAKQVDVADKLNASITDPKAGGTLKVHVGAKAVGNIDPAPGVVKNLLVKYTTADGGEVQEVAVEEGASLELQGEPKPPGPLQVLEARYGDLTNNEATIDVTGIVQGLAAKTENESVRFSVDNKILGKDPAPGKAKQIKITYTDHGATKEAVFDEGKVAEIVAGAAPAGTSAVAVPVAAAGGANKAAVPQGGGAPVAWKSVNGQLEANGQRFNLKGVNWSGMETECRQFDGLDNTTAREYLDLLAGQGINAIKIPISTTMALDPDGATRKATNDPDLAGLSGGAALQKVIALAGERGIQVVLDMARVDETQPTPELWFDGRHSTEDVLQAWDTILGRVKGFGNLMGVNLKGSPHGRACWGDSNPSFDFNKAAEQIANTILEKHPDFGGLFFVEGVSDANNVDADNKSCYASWFGGNLQGALKHPVRPNGDGADRVVYAARVFGPSVHMQDYFQRGDFPGCMWEVWDQHFGFLKGAVGNAFVISEFSESGESHEGRVWNSAFVDYCNQKGIGDGFYSSGSVTGGDWKTPANDRLEALAKLQPNPTRL